MGKFKFVWQKILGGRRSFKFISKTHRNSFQSREKKQILKWVDVLHQLLDNPAAQTDAFDPSVPDSAEEDTAKARKYPITGDSFGDSKETVPPYTTKNCIGCTAPLSGRKGQTVRCEYCDTYQIL